LGLKPDSASLIYSKNDVQSFTFIPGTKEGSFIHQGSCYLVETRARVIVFDIAAFEPDAALVKKSSPRSLHAVDHPHSSRQHSGLMSWPEHFYAQNQHKQSSEQQSNSLSARAMHLSIYGSMVCQYRITLASYDSFPFKFMNYSRIRV
jgi:hypothetical protein